jgi:hypothetical protein
MSNVYTELNVGSGGSNMDETGITYPDAPVLRRRTRIVLAGSGLNELVEVKNTALSAAEYGLITKNLPFVAAEPVTQYNLVSSVAYNTETTIATYTVPAGKTLAFTGAIGHGDLPAVYRIYVGATCKFSYRTVSSSPSINQIFENPPFTASAASVVTVKATHFFNGTSGEFEATIFGYTY